MSLNYFNKIWINGRSVVTLIFREILKCFLICLLENVVLLCLQVIFSWLPFVHEFQIIINFSLLSFFPFNSYYLQHCCMLVLSSYFKFMLNRVIIFLEVSDRILQESRQKSERMSTLRSALMNLIVVQWKKDIIMEKEINLMEMDRAHKWTFWRPQRGLWCIEEYFSRAAIKKV